MRLYCPAHKFGLNLCLKLALRQFCMNCGVNMQYQPAKNLPASTSLTDRLESEGRDPVCNYMYFPRGTITYLEPLYERSRGTTPKGGGCHIGITCRYCLFRKPKRPRHLRGMCTNLTSRSHGQSCKTSFGGLRYLDHNRCIQFVPICEYI